MQWREKSTLSGTWLVATIKEKWFVYLFIYLFSSRRGLELSFIQAPPTTPCYVWLESNTVWKLILQILPMELWLDNNTLGTRSGISSWSLLLPPNQWEWARWSKQITSFEKRKLGSQQTFHGWPIATLLHFYKEICVIETILKKVQLRSPQEKKNLFLRW